MRAHYLQHVPFEGLGAIETWLLNADFQITHTALYDAPILPSLDGIDFLIVMGGPMSVNNESEYPWLVDEKRFIGAAIRRGIPVLGICLGAQLMAATLGARVYPNSLKEIGWWPIRSVPAVEQDAFVFPDTIEALHWHGETFDIPSGAVWLAESEGFRHQAFQYGASAIGLQFHLETTPESLRSLVENCRHELVDTPFVQSEEQMLSKPDLAYERIHALQSDLLNYLLRK